MWALITRPKVLAIIVISFVAFFGIKQVINIFKERADYKRQLVIMQWNKIAEQDSLHNYKTVNGVLAQKAAFIRHISDSLETQLSGTYQLLIAQQRLTARLTAKLNTSNVAVISDGDTVLYSVFTPTYIDSGVTFNVRDSVIFERKRQAWSASNTLKFNLELRLKNTITRTAEGQFFGSVESFSPLITIGKVETVIDDQYIGNINIPKQYKVFVGVSISKYSVVGGLRYTNKRNQWGVGYVLFSNTVISFGAWYERLRLSYYYGIW